MPGAAWAGSVASYSFVYPLLILALIPVSISGCVQTTISVMPLKTQTNSIGMKLVQLPAGTFRMGDGRTEDCRPVHSVALSSFWIGQCEVSNAEFDRFKIRPRPPESFANNQPATPVTWNEAVAFRKWLSKKEGKYYRLPTEAEWEYAARGGLLQRDYPWGNESPVGRAATGQMETSPVGSFPPNGFNLYDMAGNVEEWVSDWYDATYYAHSPVNNPKGPSTGQFKVARGGVYLAYEPFCWDRTTVPLDIEPSTIGLRIVLDDSSGSKSRTKP